MIELGANETSCLDEPMLVLPSSDFSSCTDRPIYVFVVGGPGHIIFAALHLVMGWVHRSWAWLTSGDHLRCRDACDGADAEHPVARSTRRWRQNDFYPPGYPPRRLRPPDRIRDPKRNLKLSIAEEKNRAKWMAFWKTLGEHEIRNQSTCHGFGSTAMSFVRWREHGMVPFDLPELSVTFCSEEIEGQEVQVGIVHDLVMPGVVGSKTPFDDCPRYVDFQLLAQRIHETLPALDAEQGTN